MKKCECPGGIIFKPDGINELDMCLYEDIEEYKNVTVIVRKCAVCGNIDIAWIRQEDTERIKIDG